MTDGEWSNRRYQTAYEEGRAVVNAQNETLADIDDKAMRTTRLNAIFIGLLIAAVEYAPNQFHNISLSLAFGALVLSTIFGAVTYNESNLFVGPRGKYIERLAKVKPMSNRGMKTSQNYSAGLSRKTTQKSAETVGSWT